MLTKVALLALAASVSGHAMIKAATGDVSGAMAGFTYTNPNVPTQPRDKNKIEINAGTGPQGKNQRANGFMKQNNKATIDGSDPAVISKALAMANSTSIPVASKAITVQYNQMVIDGKFDVNDGAMALLDPTGKADFANAMQLEITNGASIPVINKATVTGTTVVDETFPINIAMPDPAPKCSGGPDGNACLVRVVNGDHNTNNNNLWGGEIWVIPDGAQNSTTAAAAAPATSAAAAPARRAVKFNA